jgi:hypothetical protein
MYIGRVIVTCSNASPRIIGTVKLIFMNIETHIYYDFDQTNYMFWKLVNSFKMMK